MVRTSVVRGSTGGSFLKLHEILAHKDELRIDYVHDDIFSFSPTIYRNLVVSVQPIELFFVFDEARRVR